MHCDICVSSEVLLFVTVFLLVYELKLTKQDSHAAQYCTVDNTCQETIYADAPIDAFISFENSEDEDIAIDLPHYVEKIGKTCSNDKAHQQQKTNMKKLKGSKNHRKRQKKKKKYKKKSTKHIARKIKPK